MPLYNIEHAILLTTSQKDELARAITTIHSNCLLYTSPSPRD